MTEKLVFKGNLVWLGLAWFSLVWFVFFIFLSIREVLLSIHTKFDLSMCLVGPTIKFNICSILLIKSLNRTAAHIAQNDATCRKHPYEIRVLQKSTFFVLGWVRFIIQTPPGIPALTKHLVTLGSSGWWTTVTEVTELISSHFNVTYRLHIVLKL